MGTNQQNNPLNMDGIDFCEFASPQPEKLHQLFLEFGFSLTYKHKTKSIDLYQQNDITFLINRTPNSYAWNFSKQHGPSACSMGWRVKDSKIALKTAIERGAKDSTSTGDFSNSKGEKISSIFGIGDSLIYFIDNYKSPTRFEEMGFEKHPNPILTKSKGFTVVDHLTNNVEKGTMEKWSKFYKEIFGFTEVRYFDIRGTKTGLTSYALRSACGKFCIPINEADEAKSQINEYLREYKGPGIQHIAFLTDNILDSLDQMKGSSVEMLDMDSDYYQEAFVRVPNVTEDKKRIMDHSVLVDGDDQGYLLQIFTKNIIGPIFIEIIQRKNNLSFGEGNFTALFKSIERDQMRRGVL